MVPGCLIVLWLIYTFSVDWTEDRDQSAIERGFFRPSS